MATERTEAYRALHHVEKRHRWAQHQGSEAECVEAMREVSEARRRVKLAVAAEEAAKIDRDALADDLRALGEIVSAQAVRAVDAEPVIAVRLKDLAERVTVLVNEIDFDY